KTFVMGPGVTTNGVFEPVSASAEGSAGNGGSVTVIANGSGGVEINDDDQIVVSPSEEGGGNGGSITVGASAANGDIVFNNPGLMLDASALAGTDAVNAAFAGGQISLTAGRALVGSNAGAVTLQANTFAGAAGSISLTTHGSTGAGDILIGVGIGEFNLVATANTSGVAAIGNGGTITLSSGRKILVDPAGISIGGSGANLNGGTLNWTAGTTGAGAIFVDGDLSADGQGVGNGGTISLSILGAQSRFEIGPGAANDNGIN